MNVPENPRPDFSPDRLQELREAYHQRDDAEYELFYSYMVSEVIDLSPGDDLRWGERLYCVVHTTMQSRQLVLSPFDDILEKYHGEPSGDFVTEFFCDWFRGNVIPGMAHVVTRFNGETDPETAEVAHLLD